MRFRAALGFLLLAVCLALAATGCGGGGGAGKSSDSGGSVPAGADFVASSARGYATVDTDFEGDGWKALDDLASKFPDRGKLLTRLRGELVKKGLTWEEIKAALGPQTDVGVFQGNNGIFLTKPKDESKFEALARKMAGKDPAFFKKIGDWVAASDKQASVEAAGRAHEGTSLAEGAALKEAFGDLTGSALARLWVDGKALSSISSGLMASNAKAPPKLPGVGTLQWLAAALQAKDNGVRFSFVAKSQAGSGGGISTYESKLVDEVPSGVLAYISFNNLAPSLRQLTTGPFAGRLKKLEADLGVTIEQLIPLFEKEGAIYVRPSGLLPEATVALQVDDEAAARTTADALVPKLGAMLGLVGAPTTTTVEGVSLKALKGKQFSLYWGVFDGKLVISNSTGSVTGLKSGDKLSDDSAFGDARDSAEMPDATSGFLYLNLKDIVPLIQNFATTASATIPPGLFENLEPLRSLLVYGTSEDGKTRATGFLGID